MHTLRFAAFSSSLSLGARIGIGLGIGTVLAGAIARTGMLRAAAQRLRRAISIVPADEPIPFSCSLD